MNRILHFGPGNFFRAHMADYTEEAGGWRITGVSLRSPAIRDGLAAQGWRYTLALQGGVERTIGCLEGILVAPEDPGAVLAAIRDPGVAVISATVTEKAYHLTPAGDLDLDDPAIRAEIETGAPATLIGYLALGLAGRQAPVTVLSCDNRMGNGDALARAVGQFRAAAGLSHAADVRYPNAMVDRITPATDDALRAVTGDPMAVPCEAFREWVIEDDFAGPRPDWPGVTWVSDVRPHEMRKLRMLNGTHSWLAYAGVPAGHEFVHEAVADPALRAGAERIMKEAATTLPPEVRALAGNYGRALLTRFGNPLVRHRLRQIAMDGSEKVPYRLIGTLRDRAEMGLTSPGVAAAVSAWIGFCAVETAAGRPLEDPRGAQLARAARSEDPTMAVLSLIGAADLAGVIAE